MPEWKKSWYPSWNPFPPSTDEVTPELPVDRTKPTIDLHFMRTLGAGWVAFEHWWYARAVGIRKFEPIEDEV